MAISQTVITNRLDKKINYGKARTAYDAVKGPLNEAIASPMPQGTDKFWVESHSIPTVSPSTNTAQVDVWQYGLSNTLGIIEMTIDTTVSSGRTFLACSTYGQKTTRLDAWIPTTYGATYDVKFYIGPSGNHGNVDIVNISGFTQIFPSATGTEFYFDYDSGVFAFAGDNIPSGLTGNSLYLTSGWRYVGGIGLTSYIPTVGSSLVLKEINEPVPANNFSQIGVDELHFDVDSGFALTDVSAGGKNITKIAMESTFKHWNVLGQDPITASGVDEITVAAGDGITLTTVAPPSITQTYYVKFSSGNYIFEDATGGVGTGNPIISFNFVAGGTYVFDTSNLPSTGSQFELSETTDGTWGGGTRYTNGVTYGDSGGRIADGTAGAFLQIKGKNDTATTLYDYNHDAGGTGDGSGATISAQQKTLTIKNSIIDSYGNAVIPGDLTVHGTTTTVNSNITTIDDPIITLGAGSTTYTLVDDDKDRGIEFKWHDGTAPVADTAILAGSTYIIKIIGTLDWTTVGASAGYEVGTKFLATFNGPGTTLGGEAILASSSHIGFFGFDDSLGKFTYIPDGINASELYSGTVGTFNLSGTVIDEIKDVNVGVPGSSEDGKVLTWNDATGKFVLATPGVPVIALGPATDGTYNDGAYYQKDSVVLGGTFLTGVNTLGSVSDALDAVNETIKNIKINKYVQGATFTALPIAGSASPANPFTVRFSITGWMDPTNANYNGEGSNGNATHADWYFEDATTPQNSILVSNHTNTLTNGFYDQQFISTQGGFINVTMTLKCQLAAGVQGLTEGSYMSYKKDAAVELYTPNPEPAFSSVGNITIVNLDGPLQEREIEFDTIASNYTDYWMMEFGDGEKYPATANPTETNNANIISGSNAWADHANITKYTHDYGTSSPTADEQFSPKLYCRSVTAVGGAGNTQFYERSDYIEGFIVPAPTHSTTGATTGNNDEIGDLNANNAPNTAVGHPVKFTNTTQDLGIWGATTYTWDWGDGTGDTVIGGSTSPGDVNQIIEHYFTLTDNDIAETFNVTLTAENDRDGNNVVTSPATTITVNIDPRAGFSGTYTNLNTSANSTPDYADATLGPFIGFDFLKYLSSGGGDSIASNIFSVTNTSEGTTGTSPSYDWDWDDGTAHGTAVHDTHTYANLSTLPIDRDVTLITTTTNSYPGGTDDTEAKADYVEIRPAPAVPDGLTGFTTTIPIGDVEGTSPAICVDTDINFPQGTSLTPPAAGSAVTRVVLGTLTGGTEELSGWANEFPSNGTYTAYVTAYVNDSVAGDGKCDFDGSNKVGRWNASGGPDVNGVLEITTEQDANAAVPATYPDNFYKLFKARIIPTLLPGYNTLQLKHDDATQTDIADLVYDPMIDNPTITTFGAIAENVPVYRYMSSVPFYKTGSSLNITGAEISNLTGQTYRLTTEVVRVKNETGTPIIASDTKYTYAEIGLGVVPGKNIGVSADHLCSVLALDVDGTGSGDDGVIQMTAHNVNGDAPDKVDTTKTIRYWFDAPVLDENSIPMGITYGAQVGSNTTGHRINYGWPLTALNYPSYLGDESDDWWGKTWNSETTTIINTPEAACYLDKIQHSIVNYSTGYLPAGPNLAGGNTYGRTTSATQYFTFAFQRTGLSKFSIKITGEVTSLYIAIPGYDTDETSTLNGWLDCSTNYGGSGFPGADTSESTGGIRGNGSNGIRRLGLPVDQGSFAVNTVLTDSYCNLDLGEASTGSAPYPTVLVRFGVANGKSVTAISIENWDPGS